MRNDRASPGTWIPIAFAVMLGVGVPGDARALTRLECLDQVGRDPVAAQAAAEQWEHHGGGADAQYCLAESDVAMGMTAQAAGLLTLLAHQPYRDEGQRTQVAGFASQASQAWWDGGSYPQACEIAAFGLSIAPQDMGLKLAHAQAAIECGQVDKAIADLAILPEQGLAPELRTRALLIRASAYRRAGSLALAASDLEQVLRNDPDNIAALLERGIVRARSGDLGGARKDWQAVTSLAPDTHEASLASQDLALLEIDPDAP